MHAPYKSDFDKRKIIKETWVVEMPALYAMGAAAFLVYAIDVEPVFEAIKNIPEAKSYDTMVLITCRDEEQCDTILEAARKAKRTLEH